MLRTDAEMMQEAIIFFVDVVVVDGTVRRDGKRSVKVSVDGRSDTSLLEFCILLSLTRKAEPVVRSHVELGDNGDASIHVLMTFACPVVGKMMAGALIFFRNRRSENPLMVCHVETQGELKRQDKDTEFNTQAEFQPSAFLPRNNYITALYILFIHRKDQHAGTEYILTQFRQSSSTIAASFGNDSEPLLAAKPFRLPDFSVHPHLRVEKPNYPFEKCGLDAMGPFVYKTDQEESRKCWIPISTSFNGRAIVVDIVHNLSANSFLNSLRRFSHLRLSMTDSM
ncbi:unnamed protein product [Heligmosomoides polygyrus]|uniref:C2 tensin-type domain-containing protein n=1 Tax=Heligmosomoides polygyrus TaxID=6339 RepID=A0A3P8E7Q7_HELPZ|nr:unnamed protein product [Heligmosomoides polygyrus]